jgi:hypothetical protein
MTINFCIIQRFVRNGNIYQTIKTIRREKVYLHKGQCIDRVKRNKKGITTNCYDDDKYYYCHWININSELSIHQDGISYKIIMTNISYGNDP